MKFIHVIYDTYGRQGTALVYAIIILLVYRRDIKGLECQHLLAELGHHWTIILHPRDVVHSSALLCIHHN